MRKGYGRRITAFTAAAAIVATALTSNDSQAQTAPVSPNPTYEISAFASVSSM